MWTGTWPRSVSNEKPLCVVGVQPRYHLGERSAVVYLGREFPKFPPVCRLSSDGRCELRSLGQSGRFPTGPSASGHLDPCESEEKKLSATSATGVLAVGHGLVGG